MRKLTSMFIVAGAVLLSAAKSFCGEMYDANVSDFPRVEGDTSDTQRIQRAIDSAPFGVVCIPKGEYKLDSTVKVVNAASLQMHKSAKFSAVKPMETMLAYDGKISWKHSIEKANNESLADHGMFIAGGDFDACGLADECISLVNYRHFTFRDTVFRNPKKFGLRVGDEKKSTGGYELIANNLYFRCGLPGLAGNVGMCIYDGDSHYTDCVVIDYTTGIHVRRGGSNRLTRCHVWGGPIPPPQKGELPEMLKDSICFRLSGGDAVLRDCYADTGMIGFKIEGNSRVLGCAYFNNWRFKMDNPTVFDHVKGKLLVSDGYFTKTSNSATLYKGNMPDKFIWRDNVVNGFKPEELGLPQTRLNMDSSASQVYDFEKPEPAKK